MKNYNNLNSIFEWNNLYHSVAIIFLAGMLFILNCVTVTSADRVRIFKRPSPSNISFLVIQTRPDASCVVDVIENYLLNRGINVVSSTSVNVNNSKINTTVDPGLLDRNISIESRSGGVQTDYSKVNASYVILLHGFDIKIILRSTQEIVAMGYLPADCRPDSEIYNDLNYILTSLEIFKNQKK